MSELRMLIGIPGSGKTTYANTLKQINNEIVIISSDDIRSEFQIPPNERHDETFAILKERFENALLSRKDVILDMTNLKSKYRLPYLKKAVALDYKVTYVFMTLSLEECIDRDSKRKNPVGRSIITRMSKSMEMTDKEEMDLLQSFILKGE